MTTPTAPSNEIPQPNVTEAKVKWGTAGALVTAALAAVIAHLTQGGPDAMAQWPDWLRWAVTIALPGLGSYFAGRQAPHTFRARTGTAPR